jgi:hypothetical protein
MKKLKKKEVQNQLEVFWKKYGINCQFNIMDLGNIPKEAEKILIETGDIESAEKAYSESIQKYKVK